MPAFKVGDRVRVINPNNDHGLLVGLEGNIISIDVVGDVKIDTLPRFHWRADRFELVADVAQAAPFFKKGDRLRLISDIMLPKDRFFIGALATATEDQRNGGDGNTYIRIKYDHYDTVCNHKVSRFELVNAAPRPFKVGDKVKIVAKVETNAEGITCNWSVHGGMEKYLNDGKEYVIERVEYNGAQMLLDNGWHYLIECLVHADGVAVPKKEFPVLKADDFKVGDKAIIIRKVERDGVRWNPEMNKMLNDGKKYVVKSITNTGKIRLDNGWLYLPDSLAIDEKKKPKPKKPKKPKMRSLRSLLREKVSKGAPGGICSFAMQTKEGQQEFQLGGPCHAALSYLVYTGAGEVSHLAYSVAHEMKYTRAKEFPKEYKMFMKYILNESPWAKCFLTKDTGTASRYEIEMDVSQSRHHLAGACVALRQGSEFAGMVLPMFKLIMSKGFSAHTAFIMSCAFYKRGKDDFVRRGMNGGHDILSHYMNVTQLMKFFREGYHIPTDGQPFSTNRGSYRIFNHIAKDDGASIGAWLNKNTEAKTIGEGFHAKKLITEQSVLEVATKIEQMIGEKA